MTTGADTWECGRCGEKFALPEVAQRHADQCDWPTMRAASALTSFKVSDEDYGESVAIEHDCGWVKVWTWQEVATLAALVDAAMSHLREAHDG